MQPAQMGAFMRVFMRTVAVGSMLFGLSAAAIGPVLAQMQPLPPAQQGPPPGPQAMPPPGPPAAPPPGAPYAQPAPQTMQPGAGEFSPNEIVDAGHRFFGGISRGLATIVEKAVSQWGLPNGYILGEEGGGAACGPGGGAICAPGGGAICAPGGGAACCPAGGSGADWTGCCCICA